MLLLKATIEEQEEEKERLNENIRAKIKKLSGAKRKEFDAELKKRMDTWTRDYIAGKSAPFMNEIISGRVRIPPEFQKKYDKLKDKIEKEIEYPSRSKLTLTQDKLFDDEPDAVDLTMNDVTIDYDDVISRTQLMKAWVKHTKGADKKFPTVKAKDYDYLEDKDGVMDIAYKDKYSKEALKVPKKEKGESAEDFKERKKKHQEFKDEFENEKELWDDYVTTFGVEFPTAVEDAIKEGPKDANGEKNLNYSAVVVEDFEKKLSELFRNPEVYNSKKLKSQYQSKKLAEMLVKNESMKELFEEMSRKQLSPPQDEVDEKRDRVAKLIFLNLSGSTLPTGGELTEEKDGEKTFQRAYTVIGGWVRDRGLRKKFVDARDKNQDEILLKNEVEEYNDLLRALYNKKRDKWLKRHYDIVEIDSKGKAITEIKKYLSKEFGVKGISIITKETEIKDKDLREDFNQGRDILIEFNVKGKTRQESLNKIKQALNRMAEYEATPDSGDIKSAKLVKKQRIAVNAYEEIPNKLRENLRKLLFKGKLPDEDDGLTDLFITKDSTWVSGSWTNPVIREDARGREATEMMKDLIEISGEDEMRPPRKIKELDVARRKVNFLQESKKDQDKLERKFTIDRLIQNDPNYDTVRKNLIFLEDEIEDNIKVLLDKRRKVKGGEQIIHSQLETVANLVAYYNVSIQNSVGQKALREFKVLNNQLDRAILDLKKALKIPKIDLSSMDFRELQAHEEKEEKRRQKQWDRAIEKTKSRVAPIFEKTQKIHESFSKDKENVADKKSPFRGSLEDSLQTHAKKADFDLDGSIEKAEKEVEGKYKNSSIDEFNELVKTITKHADELQAIYDNPEEYAEEGDPIEFESGPKRRRRKKTDFTPKAISERKKKIIAELREENPKMPIEELENLAMQQLKEKSNKKSN